jgi:hypothetical protein
MAANWSRGAMGCGGNRGVWIRINEADMGGIQHKYIAYWFKSVCIRLLTSKEAHYHEEQVPQSYTARDL